MPNWIVGDLKIRSNDYKNVDRFLDENLIPVTYSGKESIFFYKEQYVEDEYIETTYRTPSGQEFYLKDSHRCFVPGNIYLYTNVDDNTVCVEDLQCAWSPDIDYFKNMSEAYNVDFKSYMYERGSEYEKEFEFHNGETIIDKSYTYDNYVWESRSPNIGG